MKAVLPRVTRFLLCLLLTAAALSWTASATEPLQIRILTYNIHHGEGTDGKVDLERIARVIGEAEPDLVALQECDRNTHRSGGADQPAELARLTGLHGVFGKNIDYSGGEYGNAVLSRWPIVRHRNHLLPRLENREQRGVLEVLVRPEGGETPLRLLATHLDHSRDDAERLACSDALAALAAQQTDVPVILAGDLNDVANSRVAARLSKTWTFPGGDPVPTIPSDRPQRQIDFVLWNRSPAWKLIEQRAISAPEASDHLPLLVVLSFSATRALRVAE